MPDDVGEWISILRKAANELLTLKAIRNLQTRLARPIEEICICTLSSETCTPD